jgi:hypothetical protein
MSEPMTAQEKAMAIPVKALPNRIPAMTDPMGKHWRQPPHEEITIDDKNALMSQTAFEKLADYSYSQPTGCYPGKMWKSGRKIEGIEKWWLCWYDYSEKGPEWCSTLVREILIA